ncbi:hypothetical protein LL037_22050 [Clostridium estertheticum]|uniref:PilN domain-containing protein n=1 Tax=Clostridium estertheticum TaxID=238834 RepID=UPI001C0C65C0|nr:PilN domain-containing protein [Clostridium estertheticum]MBU3198428.1 hypothetical protein [Clostridium estertheticum]WAG65109.1 hypothetical protein LL037_22050 [Clostridium estertheticum]
MRDLNFFLPYIENNKESKKTNVILTTLTAIVLMYVIGTTVWYFSNKIILGGNIKKLQSEINDINLQNQYKKANVTIKKYTLLNKYNDEVTNTLKSISSKEIGSSNIMKTIFSTLPQEVSVVSILIDLSTVQLQCTSSNRISIAELQRNLLQIDNITNVEVSGLSADSTKKSYGFLVKCTLKGVDVK